MFFPISIAATLTLAGAVLPQVDESTATVQGFDISHFQPTVNFQAAYDSGSRFVIIKVGSLESSVYNK
jgi:hypothetical protein